MKLSGRSSFHRLHPACLICVLVAILLPTTVAAQNIDRRASGSGSTARQSVPDQPRASTTPFSSRAAMKERVNANTIGVIAGGIDGTEIRIAADLAAVLDDADAGGGSLHILPALGDGSVRNLNDLMYLQDTDIGIVQSDVLAYAQRDRQQSNLNEQLRYITQLYSEEFHLLAGRGIRSVEDLAGRKVNIDAPGSGTAITASLVFNMLKIGIEPVHFDQELALQKLHGGDIAALAYVSGKPTPLFRDLDGSDGLHFLSLPLTDVMLDTYLPSSLTADDYPHLIPEGARIETVATSAIMVVYNWKRDTGRYRKAARFVDAFFSSIDEFQRPPRHPKWQEVNLTARVPGWERFEAAEAWLRQAQEIADSGSNDPANREAFRAFIQERAGRTGHRPLTAEQADALFQKFLRWRSQHER